MKKESITEDVMVQYLLGKLSEEEELELERLYFLNDDLHEELQSVELDLIDRYVNNELSNQDAERFENYFSSSPRRINEVKFAKALRSYVNRTTTEEGVKGPGIIRKLSNLPRPFFTPARFAAVAVITIALGLALWWFLSRGSSESRVILALNEAGNLQRPTLTRISELDYGSFLETRSASKEEANNTGLDKAEVIALDEVYNRPGPASYHSLGRVYLAKHSFQEAVTQLQKALDLAPSDAGILNDMGVALLEKARINEDAATKAVELAQSRLYFDKSIELDNSYLEPAFNRALWYEYMSLPDDARHEWQKYLDRDSKSKWADEARQRLAAIEEKKRSSQSKELLFQDFFDAYENRDDQKAWQAFGRSRARTGNVITEKLLDNILQSSSKGQDYSGDVLKLSYAGSLEYRRTGDRFTADLAGFYNKATLEQQRLIQRARELVMLANESCKQTEYEKAIEYFSEARHLFQQSGDYCEAAFAQSWVGNCNLRIAPDKSLLIFENLLPEFERRKYKWLLAQALYALSDAQSSKRNFSKSLQYSDRSSQISTEIADPAGILRNMQFPVSMHQQTGDYAKSLGVILGGFDLAAGFSPEPQEIWPFYHQTAFNLYSMGFPTVALGFQQEALRIAQLLGTPIYISRSYALLGLIHQKMKDYEQAIQDAQMALVEAEKIAGEKSRNNLIANSTLNLAHVYLEAGDFASALDAYNRAIELHERLNLGIYLFQAHRGKLLSLMSMEDDAAIEAEIKTAVALLEDYRPRIQEESNRINFFDLAQSIYDIAIDFTFSRMNRRDEAFDCAEMSHARSLLDLMATPSEVIKGAYAPDIKVQSVTQPVTRHEILRQLPDGVQLLQYAVLKDKLLIWVISKDFIQGAEQAIAAEQINEKVERFLRLILANRQEDLEEIVKCGKDLYTNLLLPVKPWLDDQKQLYIIPDKFLNRLPFGALMSANSRYLVEDYRLALTPSSSIFLKCSVAAVKKAATKPERILGIGNPYFDSEEFPRLPRLPSAANEATAAAGLYESRALLLEKNATTEQVKSEMAKADVIHFAGHYVTDPRSPMLSKLLLAKSQASSGYLTVSEIYNMKLPKTRLAVLSACQTGIERSYKGEGAISVARPFIQAGVPVVVASLWPIETLSAEEVMISFHKHRKQQGDSTINALKHAQEEMIHHRVTQYNHPYFWASFTIIGGAAPF